MLNIFQIHASFYSVVQLKVPFSFSFELLPDQLEEEDACHWNRHSRCQSHWIGWVYQSLQGGVQPGWQNIHHVQNGRRENGPRKEICQDAAAQHVILWFNLPSTLRLWIITLHCGGRVGWSLQSKGGRGLHPEPAEPHRHRDQEHFIPTLMPTVNFKIKIVLILCIFGLWKKTLEHWPFFYIIICSYIINTVTHLWSLVLEITGNVHISLSHGLVHFCLLLVQIFVGNVDNDSTKTNLFDPPIIAQYMRIIPVVCRKACTLRMELVGCELNGRQWLKNEMSFSGCQCYYKETRTSL